MKRRRSQTLLSGIVLTGLLTAPASCLAQGIVCPKTVAVKQELAGVEPPWEALQEEVPSQLMSVTIFDGHPKQRATLVPDAEAKRNGNRVYTWHLASNRTQTYWIGCSYDRTNMMLIRPLDPGIASCQVTYDPRVTIAGHPSVIGIACK